MTPIPIDKQGHGWAGAAIVSTLRPYLGLWALVPVALIAYAKEQWDRRHGGTYDPRDFWATIVGALLQIAADACIWVALRFFGVV